MKVSFSPDIILCGWVGLKHQLTNYLTSVNENSPKGNDSELSGRSDSQKSGASCLRVLIG